MAGSDLMTSSNPANCLICSQKFPEVEISQPL